MSGSIGPHTFLLLTGRVGKLAQEIEVIEKPGEDGSIRRDLGRKNPIFKLISTGAYTTKDALEDALETFNDMKTEGPANGAPVDLVKDGYNFNTDAAVGEKIQVAVLQVEPLESEFKACVVGTSNRWLLVTQWTLLGVPV